MSSIKLMLRLAALLFIAEAAIMFGGALLMDQSLADWGRTLAVALFDAVLLVLIAGFAIHHWALKPFLADRNAAQRALRESEALFRQLSENIPQVFWMTDLEKNEVLYVSPAYEQVWGRSCESLYDNPMSFVDAIHPDDRAEVIDDIGRQAQGAYDAEYRVVRPDGSVRLIRDRAFPVRDADGKVYRIAGIAEDVTEKKRSEEALRDSEERIRGIIENSPDSIVLKDRMGRFQLANRNFLARYGLTEAQVLGKTAYDFHPKEIADLHAVQDRQVVESGSVIRDNITVSFADGREHDLVVTRFPIIDNQGRVLGIGSISADVTEQKKAQQALHEAQKMDAVGQLTGGVAHDFNNMLAVILGNAERLQRRPESSDKSIQAIIQAATRGVELTQRLLAFSRRQPLQCRPVDLNQLVEGMTALLSRTLGETIKVETSLDADLWPTVADSGQVESALLNLALNARDAMPGGGSLRIMTANVVVDAEQEPGRTKMEPGDYVVLGIADSGTGIPPEVLEHVFEPFFTTKDVGEGSGLGLSMVYGFAKQSGGGVGIESRRGEGTTVEFYLPRGKQAVDRGVRSKPPSSPPRGRGETVLVVEDDHAVRAVAEAMLGDLGYRAIVAEDARTGLQILKRSRKVALLLSDVDLPGGVSGPDMVERAREAHPDLKVLFMSGHARGAMVQGRELGIDGHLLTKPFREIELARKVRSILDDGA